MKLPRKFALSVALLGLAVPIKAVAWDSAGPEIGNKTYTRPAYNPTSSFDPFIPLNASCGPASWPAVPPTSQISCFTPDAVDSGRFNYVAKIFHLATANAVGDTTDSAGMTRGLLECPPNELPRMDAASDVGPVDLTGCQPSPWARYDNAQPTSQFESKFGEEAPWTAVRRAWSNAQTSTWKDFHTPEHMLITEQAAVLAGFDPATNPLFTQRFWVKYPVLDAFVASPTADIATGLPAFVVGQTYKPTKFADGRAHALRAIYLPELAQLPDVSYSVWDWAAGNEVCPIQGLDSTTGGANAFAQAGVTQYDVNNCHAYTRLLGPLNMSHFKPDNQALWSWYHKLATDRMAVCVTLKSQVTPLDQPNMAGIDPNTTFGTEAHECEREALIYEMVAQHFLQDNWSTGHMWARWGAPDLASIPTNFANPPLWSTLFPNENLLARQVIHATVLAAAAGTIHGTKAITQRLLPPAVQILADDPLSGPLYANVSTATLLNPVENQWFVPDLPVMWNLDGSTNAGVGDYFWAPDPSLGKVSLSTDQVDNSPQRDYSPQRTHLLSCAAASLRQVYLAGPQVHGPLLPAGSVEGSDGGAIDAIDPSSDYCWGNYATNASMEGSLASFFVSRNWGLPLNALLVGVGGALGGVGGAVANLFGISALTPLMNFITSEIIINKNFLPANAYSGMSLAYEEALGAVLSAQWVLDTNKLTAAFEANNIHNSSGTDSAQLHSATGPLTMLGVSPNSLMPCLTGTPPTPCPVGPAPNPPTYYADVSTPRGDESTNPGDYFVRRMFWRSHLSETCAEVDWPTMQALQGRCLAAAPLGGDPDACTACVEAVEPHVASCGPDPTLGPSKCQALGTDISASLPAQWFDPSYRWGNLCQTPNEVAVEYCTGTEAPGITDSMFGQSGIDSTFVDNADMVIARQGLQITTSSACQVHDLQSQATLSTTNYQIAVLHTEGAPTQPTPDSLVTAFGSTTTGGEVVSGTECTQTTSISSESLAAQTLAPFPITGNLEHYSGAFFPEGAYDEAIGFCGATQRRTLWNRTCSDVLSTYPLQAPSGAPLLSAAPGIPTGQGYGYQDYSFSHETLGVLGGVLQSCVPSGDPDDTCVTEDRCTIVEPVTYSRNCPQAGGTNGTTCNSSDLCVPSTGFLPQITYLSSW